jgi:hypothetical protein
MHPYHHALSSVKKHGGKPEDYLPIHNWFDASKSGFADSRHRAMRHHSEGIFWCEEHFGITITNSEGKVIPTRVIGEQHVIEDLRKIPTMKDWLEGMKIESWMLFTNRLTSEEKESLSNNIPTEIKIKQ